MLCVRKDMPSAGIRILLIWVPSGQHETYNREIVYMYRQRVHRTSDVNLRIWHNGTPSHTVYNIHIIWWLRFSQYIETLVDSCWRIFMKNLDSLSSIMILLLFYEDILAAAPWTWQFVSMNLEPMLCGGQVDTKECDHFYHSPVPTLTSTSVSPFLQKREAASPLELCFYHCWTVTRLPYIRYTTKFNQCHAQNKGFQVDSWNVWILRTLMCHQTTSREPFLA